MIADRILMAAGVCLSLGGAVGVNVHALANTITESRGEWNGHPWVSNVRIPTVSDAVAVANKPCPSDRTRVLVSPGVVKCAKDLTEPK